MTPAITGLWPPVSTPFADDGAVDARRLVHHSRTLLADGAHGLAILGTTSEANSLTLDERRKAIDAHLEAGIPAAKLLPGTGAAAIGDAAALPRHAGEIGVAAGLLPPPLFYKKRSDEGVYAFIASVIERSGPKVPRIMLYHIPQMAGDGFSLELIGRLREAFPDLVVGLKDSAGAYDYTKSVIDAFPGFAVFPGAEVYLVKALRNGAAGCISASANINARGIRGILDHWRDADADARQEAANAIRKAVEGRTMIAAVKTVLAERYRDGGWRTMRPPLMALDAEARAALLANPAIAGLLESVAA